jgi:hypothetical protein
LKRVTINGVTYELVAEFIYLGTLISNDNSVQKEIQRSIWTGNRTYFAAISLFRNRLLPRAIKIRLYKKLIGPIVAYGAEIRVMAKKEEQAVLTFGRKIFRKYMVLNMIYFLTAIGLPPGGSTHLHTNTT